jgi:hypothetical protein
MLVRRATCSCYVELYKLWYTLADFLPNWDISRGFLYILFTGRISEPAMGGGGGGGKIIDLGCSVAQLGSSVAQ